MNIAIIGYGKMGHIIEEIALAHGHKIVCIIDNDNHQDIESPEFCSADVAIEFSRPSAALDNILHCFAAKVPVVCGTTGWTDALPEVKEICEAGKGSLLVSSNFSIGMNIFMATNRYLTSLMRRFPEYYPEIDEIHHIHKLDHPSGTAITLADEIISLSPRLKDWQETDDDVIVKESILPIHSHREGEVAGIHSITWMAEADEITITHSAHNRRGFAAGAILAAEWLVKQKRGYYTIHDVLGF